MYETSTTIDDLMIDCGRTFLLHAKRHLQLVQLWKMGADSNVVFGYLWLFDLGSPYIYIRYENRAHHFSGCLHQSKKRKCRYPQTVCMYLYSWPLAVLLSSIRLGNTHLYTCAKNTGVV